ncbi:MAG: VCBS repeat-containing protein, partial [Bacteroidetes bacterium]|nr:VCBS repeat-containing protein [Bacteroidota bacterium]
NMHTVDGDFIDLNLDGFPDIVTGNGFGNSFEFYLNDKKGKFTRATEKILPASVRGDGIDIEAADFNGDGKTDLYLCNFLGSDILLFGR